MTNEEVRKNLEAMRKDAAGRLIELEQAQEQITQERGLYEMQVHALAQAQEMLTGQGVPLREMPRNVDVCDYPKSRLPETRWR